MTMVQMVLLAKSWKNGEYCVGGIDLKTNRWIRLVTDNEATHGAVSAKDLTTADGQEAGVLDVIEAPLVHACPTVIQPENYLLDQTRQIRIIRRMTLDQVLAFHKPEGRSMVYYNALRSVPESTMNAMRSHYSLIMIRVSDLTLHYEVNSQGKVKLKSSFDYNSATRGMIHYEHISVTDPEYFGDDAPTEIGDAILVISLGEVFNGNHYKYVASIFPL